MFVPLEKLVQILCPEERIEMVRDAHLDITVFIPRLFQVPTGIRWFLPFMPARIVITDRTYFIDARLEAAVRGLIYIPFIVFLMLLVFAANAVLFNVLMSIYEIIFYIILAVLSGLFGIWLSLHTGRSIFMISREWISEERHGEGILTLHGEIRSPAWISLDALGKEQRANIPGFIMGGFLRHAFSIGVMVGSSTFHFILKFISEERQPMRFYLRNLYLFILHAILVIGMLVVLLLWFLKNFNLLQ